MTVCRCGDTSLWSSSKQYHHHCTCVLSHHFRIDWHIHLIQSYPIQWNRFDFDLIRFDSIRLSSSSPIRQLNWTELNQIEWFHWISQTCTLPKREYDSTTMLPLCDHLYERVPFVDTSFCFMSFSPNCSSSIICSRSRSMIMMSWGTAFSNAWLGLLVVGRVLWFKQSYLWQCKEKIEQQHQQLSRLERQRGNGRKRSTYRRLIPWKRSKIESWIKLRMMKRRLEDDETGSDSTW